MDYLFIFSVNHHTQSWRVSNDTLATKTHRGHENKINNNKYNNEKKNIKNSQVVHAEGGHNNIHVYITIKII